MKTKSNKTLAVVWLTMLMWAGFNLAAGPYPPPPFYNYTPPTPFSPANFVSGNGSINLVNVPPATDAAGAEQNFNARAAAVIFQAASGNLPANNLDNGQGWQSTLLAKWAYQDYLNDNTLGLLHRVETYDPILSHQVGTEGTDTGSDPQNEYDFTLNYYIPLVYRYYNSMPGSVSDYLINNLLSQSMRSGDPGGRSGVGSTGSTWSEWVHIPDIIDIPETENHLLGIETARYLVNQLLYQRTQNSAYDNMRNGNSDTGAPNTTDWVLHALQGFLKDDFLEYNARPYQDFDMSALLNLATYAYDDRVRIGARMVLDYISAKIAVSSSDLRRAPPFRRRNESRYYGPAIYGNFLGTPLLSNTDAGENDTQTPYYSMLAGNTQMFFPDATSPPNPLGQGELPGNYNWEMVHAGLCDYRVPPPILDLFANRADRRFYQYFHHYAYNNEYADELYAGSPSYLITAGGRSTTFCYKANVQAPIEVIIDALSAYFLGLPAVVIELIAENATYGASSDLGSAMPTSFMPAGQGVDLSEMIQFGEYTTDESQIHMGVAPDFACGDHIYIPDAIRNDPGNVTFGTSWTFVNRGGAPGQPGYYLAIYTADNLNGGIGGFLEAYDTWLHPGSPAAPTFDEFVQGVLAANPSVNLQFGNNQVNSYTTQSGQAIQFTLSPHAQIVSTTELNPAPANNSAFTAGSVLNSQQGSGLVVVSNPSTGGSITLDMRDAFHPRRTSETGVVDYAGEEVWVNFNYGNNSGDFAQPYRTLGKAKPTLNLANPAKVFKIVSGVEHEAVTISQPVQLIAVGGPVTIYGQ